MIATGNQPLISIVLTLYNKKEYIEEQIFSIRKQTYRNWELIIVDDASTDWSYELTQALCSKLWIYDKCIFVQNPQNLWLAITFYEWLKHVTGEYVAICDADDVWMLDKLERNLNFLKCEKRDLIYSNLIETDEFNRPLNCHNVCKNISRNNHIEKLIRCNHATAPTIFFTARVAKHLLEYECPISTYQDYRVMLFCSCLWYSIGFDSSPLIYYRRYSTSLSIIDAGHDNLVLYLTAKRLEKTNILRLLLQIKTLNKRVRRFLSLELIANDYLYHYLMSEYSFLWCLGGLLKIGKIEWIYILLKYSFIKHHYK